MRSQCFQLSGHGELETGQLTHRNPRERPKLKQECSPEPIYEISTPQGLVRWLGFLCTGMELAGKPASKQLLAYCTELGSLS